MPTMKGRSHAEKASSWISAGTRKDGLEHGDVEVDVVGVGLGFVGGVAGGAAEVAEVIEREAGHDGVQVDNGDAPLGGGIEEGVVDLGVVVGDALGNLPAKVTIQQVGHQVTALTHELEFLGDLLGAVADVLIGGLLERRVAHRGVVEIGDGLVEPGGGQVGHHVLELRKAARGLKGDVRVAHVVVALHPIDEVVEPPPLAGKGAHAVALLAGVNQREDLDVGILLGLRAEMGERALDVVHHLLRLAKDGVVDALEGVDVARAVGLLGGDAIGVIDMAAAIGFGLNRRALDGKAGQDLLDLLLHTDAPWDGLKEGRRPGCAGPPGMP